MNFSKGILSMKIILADPPGVIPRTPNLGILYLIAAIRRHFKDQNVEIRYLETFLSLNDQLKAIQEFKPDFYGISFASFFAPICFQTMNAVKDKFPDLPVICGGAHPTADPEGVLAATKADICVLGEGEGTIIDLIDYFRNGGDLKNIPGIAFRQDGQVIRTRVRDFIRDIDTIDFPAWDVVDFKRYIGITLQKTSPYMMVIVSRGCPYNCTYCSNPVWKSGQPWHRARSAKNIAQEIEYLYGRGIREITLRCDEFNIDLNWSLDVCREIKKLNHPDLYLQTILRVDQVTEDLAQALRSVNCWLVMIGIESGNQRTLDGLRKKITLEQVRNACRCLKAQGIKVSGFFMIYNVWEENGELCYETHEDVKRTFDFARALLRQRLMDFNGWGFAVPIVGSELFKTCQRHHLIPEEDLSLFSSSRWKWKGSPIPLPGIDEKTKQLFKRKGTLLQMQSTLRNGLPYLNWRDYKYLLYRMALLLNKN